MNFSFNIIKANLVKYLNFMKAMKNSELVIIGGGLAGSEAAWQAASRGIKVLLYEMRPITQTGAHQGAWLAELVCSNSLGSNLSDRASGILKNELRTLNSLLLMCADESSVPAGGALAVDRELFAQKVTSNIMSHPNIEVIRAEITEIPDRPTIIASGPLTSQRFSIAIQMLTGMDQIFFYDALAPIVYKDSIDFKIVFQGSRYGKNGGMEDGDYLNCPMSREHYDHFVDELINAERIPLRDFESDISKGVRAGIHRFFEGCLPVEIIAARGRDALAYGPLRPVGLTDPHTGKHSYAVVQLRQDNLARTLYNLVGFQTNLKHSEQERVFRMIPGLEKVEFARYGEMHRNTFILSPQLLHPTLQFKNRGDLFIAGQITGVEGYVGNIATGLLAGWNASRYLLGETLLEMPSGTLIGALSHYISHADVKDFQPMKANFGILPPLDNKMKDKRMRAAAYAERSKAELQKFVDQSLNKNTPCV
jgi:methylenetetrahydrofolate--tRNA-(uracil-5-)-methyltransferase